MNRGFRLVSDGNDLSQCAISKDAVIVQDVNLLHAGLAFQSFAPTCVSGLLKGSP